MEENIKKFLQFNGKNVYFIAADGQWWIAIKPICEALGVDYRHQLELIKSSKILGQLCGHHPIVAADGKLRQMHCLPEFYIYGWIFQIRSDSPDLEQYQWKCYEVLYNHFHGTITNRQDFLKVHTKADIEIAKLEAELKFDPRRIRIEQLRIEKGNATKALNKLDREIVSTQLPIWQ